MNRNIKKNANEAYRKGLDEVTGTGCPHWFVLFMCLLVKMGLIAQNRTYCNPINLDYTYMIYNAHKDLSYRSGADPAVVRFKDGYYMFVTRSMGYWYSEDMDDWRFIKPNQWYFQGSNAPAAFNYRDSVLYMAGNPSGSMSVLYSESPKDGKWKATPAILHGLQDPALFIDDDGQAYMYWGSSNKFPIRAKKLDRKKRFRPSEEVHELFNLQPEKHGWERFGENHSDTQLKGYIEGPWMNKFKGRYYLQYAAPGTEFDVYGDGVYVGDTPLGPFEYAPNNPFSYKPGGFINGAGHGSTVEAANGQLWHFSSMAVNVNVGWERRIGMFPTFLDDDGLLFTDTYFGDYPHFVPSLKDHRGAFAEWMLLSYKKPVKASSQLKTFAPEHLVDENIRTFWVAETSDAEEWVEIDLTEPMTVHAIQVNYNDFQSDRYGRIAGPYQQYQIECSVNGTDWSVLVDRSQNNADVPNDYIELGRPVKVRYLKFRHIHVPTPHLSLSGLRIFGKGNAKPPKKVKHLTIDRGQDRREAKLAWNAVKGAQGYNVIWGIAPEKLYSSWLVYEATDLKLNSLTTDQTYFFTIEAFNENGVSGRSEVIKVE